MIRSYQKVLEMESVASLKLEQDRKALDKSRKGFYNRQINNILKKGIRY